MTADEAVLAVFEALDEARVPFMLVGSLASNFHGVPRSTRDADFVVDLESDGLARLARHLPPPLRLESQGGFESVTGTTRYLVTLAGDPFVCELFVLSGDAHDQARFTRRQAARILGRPAYVASAEDMIVTKLRWAKEASRTKDREDVRNMLAVQGSALDWPYLTRWTTEHRTTALLEEIRASLPPQPGPDRRLG